MNKKLLFLPIFVLSLFIITSVAQADVVLEDIRASINFVNQPSFNSWIIETGTGNIGDYVITSCAVTDDNANNAFSNPTPGTWSDLGTGQCGGSNSCIGGTWGRFVSESSSTETTCSWSGNSVFVFGAASMRFSQVDGEDPIIDFACATGEGTNIATAPSINTEAGSFVIRSTNFRPATPPNGFPPAETFSFVPPIFGEGYAFNSFQVIVSRLDAVFFENAGPTGTFDVTFSDGIPIQWRACTIALRMGPPPIFSKNVPTMSEWGLIGFAVFAGIAGFWFLRRRQATA